MPARDPGFTDLFVIRNQQPGHIALCERCKREHRRGELADDCRQDHKVAVFCYADGPDDDIKFPRQTNLSRIDARQLLEIAAVQNQGFAVIAHRHPPLYSGKCAGERLQELHQQVGSEPVTAG